MLSWVAVYARKVANARGLSNLDGDEYGEKEALSEILYFACVAFWDYWQYEQSMSLPDPFTRIKEGYHTTRKMLLYGHYNVALYRIGCYLEGEEM